MQKLRLPNPESVASDYLTASVAAVTGRAKRDVDRIQLLTHTIASVQQAAAAGGNRVVVVSGDGANGKSAGRRISENLMHRNEVGAPA